MSDDMKALVADYGAWKAQAEAFIVASTELAKHVGDAHVVLVDIEDEDVELFALNSPTHGTGLHLTRVMASTIRDDDVRCETFSIFGDKAMRAVRDWLNDYFLAQGEDE